MPCRLPRRLSQRCCLVGAVAIIFFLSTRVVRFPVAISITNPLTLLGTDEEPDPLPLGEHLYLPNGLLEVNKDGAHPIYELIQRAEKDWKLKLGRASKTFKEAVREYRRRYHRYPPKGFDAWYVPLFNYPEGKEQPR